ncbi:TerB family tellurite resistance protein [Thalassotalea crassostreae]|uniref:tellurite resistance TerB family protein n=1 Tax=Thalassotalea crassostreae TaxID=1763536 RepID=UPI000838CB08|nr:TerB family tellurite resistance protein [Thalassotalea crassostreae]
MLTRIRVFIRNLQTDNVHNNTLSLEIATAVLLFEVMRADQKFEPEEKQQIVSLLQQHFELDKAEVLDILALAEDESHHANDFYQYTSMINNNYSLEDRIKIVGLLWKVAYADGHLDVIEEHIIRKIAELLHLNHGEYIQCKLKIQNQHPAD